MNNDLVCVFIAEFDMLKIHITFCFAKLLCFIAFIGHFLCPKESKYTLTGCCRRLQGLSCLCDLRKGLGKQTDIHHKCNNDFKSDIAFHCQHSTHHADSHITKIADKGHQRLHQTGKALCLKSAVSQVIIQFIKNFFGIFFTVIGFDNCMSGINLFNMTI